MADLDADILALAGETSDEAESPAPSAVAVPPESPNATASHVPAEEKKGEASPKSPVSKKRDLVSTTDEAERMSKKARRDESEEEGEASPAPNSPPSLRSASMSESGSEGSPSGSKNLAPRFPVDGKFYSGADKAMVMALPEVKREEILAERATMVERDQQNRMLIQLLRDKERKEKKDMDEMDKKRKAVPADAEDSQRKSARQKVTLGGRKVGENSAPLEEYKRHREQKEAHAEQKKVENSAKEKTRKKDGVSHGMSDADADGESEVEWDGGKRTKAAQQPPAQVIPEEQSADLVHFHRAQVSSSNFAMVCFYPGFEETIAGCMIRVHIAPTKHAKGHTYRVEQIKRFTEGKPYAMEGPNHQRFVTTQYAITSHGKSENELAFIFCSGSKITQDELDAYKRACVADSVPIPTKPFLVQKIMGINQLINRKWTEAEINEKLRRSGVLTRRMAPIIRGTLRQQREDALARGDEAAIAKCDTELAALDDPVLAFGTKLYEEVDENRPLTQQERLDGVNRRNRKLNKINVRKAQLVERQVERELQAAIARGEAVANPFARVKTRAKIMHDAYADTITKPKPTMNLDELFEDETDRSGAVTPQTPPVRAPVIFSAASVPAKTLPQHNGDSSKKSTYTGHKKERTLEDIVAEEDWGIPDDLALI